VSEEHAAKHGQSLDGRSEDAARTLEPPGPAHTVTVRLVAKPSPTLLPRLSDTVAQAGAIVVGVDLVDVGAGGATVDLTLQARDQAHVDEVVASLGSLEGCRVRRVSDRTFLAHLGGKIEVVSKRPVRTRQDLALAYTPGVGRISEAIARSPEDAWTLTAKGNAVAVVTDGSAVLGLGKLGPLAALPVMEGKALLFRELAGVSAWPLCLDVSSPEELVAVAEAVSPGFGGINLEDIAAPECFWIEEELQRRCSIPVFHDDQHGTAVVVLAGLLNACRLTGRSLGSCRAVLVGIGAAGTAIATSLLDAGIGELVCFDRDGVLSADRDLLPHHLRIAERTGARPGTTITEALSGADIFIGVARRGSVDPGLIRTMAKRPIVFALSNPEPEVFADEVPLDAVLATGRSDLANQINNALCFPGFFKGALEARATRVTAGMKQAAVAAIAARVTDDELALGIIVPTIFQSGLHDQVASAVAEAWRAEFGGQGPRSSGSIRLGADDMGTE